MAHSAQNSMATIESFINEIGAFHKQAEANTEPGSIGGETGHPSKDVDDGTEVAQEGDRSSENTSDVKEDQGGIGVDATAQAKAASLLGRFAKKAEGAASSPGSAADDQLQIGTNVQPTGEDPANETDSAKGGKEDPGTDHAARTDNDDLDGHKYAFDANTPLEKFASAIEKLGNRICTAIVHGSDPRHQQTHYQQTQKRASAGNFNDPHLAYQLGDELAGIINGTMDKTAADQMVHDTLRMVIKEASDDAERVHAFLSELEFAKQAENEDPMAAMGGEDPMAGGDPPVAAMGGAGGGMGGEDDAMMAGLGGGDAAEDDGEELQPEQIMALLQQLNLTPEDIAAAAAAEGEDAGGDIGGGEDPMAAMGGAPPEAKMAADRKAKAQVDKAAADYLREILSRSRKK